MTDIIRKILFKFSLIKYCYSSTIFSSANEVGPHWIHMNNLPMIGLFEYNPMQGHSIQRIARNAYERPSKRQCQQIKDIGKSIPHESQAYKNRFLQPLYGALLARAAQF